MGFEPAPVRRAREQVELQLREAILSGALRSGERLPSELELARSFGVSRATVREALGRLASAGLISRVPGASGGSFVRSVDHASLGKALGESIDNTFRFGSISFEELNRVRRLLEVPAAREAALRRSEEDIERLRHNIERQKNASVEDPRLAELDSGFHTAIAEASGNRVLAAFVYALHSVIREVLYLNISPEEGREVVRQHIAVAREIIRGDPEGAARAMEEHLDYIDRLQVWRRRDEG
ncbi:GntR family transcriptional regulator [Rubrobacter xylanophilus]|uniref:GntR family transcriptional regulator n=1 Tax=Rubrobacter xylanophilus TaxID=49319 RepID=A0A510HIG4_9ACTN|nr:FadR/GntR family transcriptional regulator [Rubrobacter xylanophilus]BBL79771.1 GntR family transcriptional regulator [Rubrobacter xylanophilus]